MAVSRTTKPAATTSKLSGRAALHIVSLPVGTVLARVYSQPPKAADRSKSYNPMSAGRASPVRTVSGATDPAMYVAVDSEQGAALELLYHTVLKQHARGAVISRRVFDNFFITKLRVEKPIHLASIELLQAAGQITPPTFSSQRADYSDTQAVAQAIYKRYKNVSGLCWHSAQGPSVVAVLYESRMPAAALRISMLPEALLGTDHTDFIAETLALRGIVLQP